MTVQNCPLAGSALQILEICMIIHEEVFCEDCGAEGFAEDVEVFFLKSIEIRKDLTDQWKAHNVEEGVGYATLTDIIYQAWAGLTARDVTNRSASYT